MSQVNVKDCLFWGVQLLDTCLVSKKAKTQIPFLLHSKHTHNYLHDLTLEVQVFLIKRKALRAKDFNASLSSKHEIVASVDQTFLMSQSRGCANPLFIFTLSNFF